MSNATMEKFGHPAGLIRDYAHWSLLVRPAQVTLGSLVLCAKGEATAFGALAPPAFAELAAIVPSVEQALAALTGYEKLNYLMLMMVDPHVHFHIIPRYSGSRTWKGVEFADAGWPGPPALGSALPLDRLQIETLRVEISGRL